METLDFEARGGTVTLTTADVREYVLPYLRHPEARAALVSILERADEMRTWDLAIPEAPEAEEELVAQIVRAGGPAVSREARPIRLYTVDVRSEETHGREAVRYWSDTTPEIGDVIEAGGMMLTVENVLQSIKPDSDAMLIEARRSEPAE